MARRVLFFLLVWTAMTYSTSYALCPNCTNASAAQGNWPVRSISQLCQGALNMTMGWTQLFGDPIRESKDNPNPDVPYKLGNGFLMGLGKAAMTTGAGLLEGITFWTPVRIVPDTTCVFCERSSQALGEAIVVDAPKAMTDNPVAKAVSNAVN